MISCKALKIRDQSTSYKDVRRAYLVLVKMKKKGGELVHRTKSYMLSCLSRELKQIVVFLSATRAERPF